MAKVIYDQSSPEVRRVGEIVAEEFADIPGVVRVNVYTTIYVDTRISDESARDHVYRAETRVLERSGRGVEFSCTKEIEG